VTPGKEWFELEKVSSCLKKQGVHLILMESRGGYNMRKQVYA